MPIETHRVTLYIGIRKDGTIVDKIHMAKKSYKRKDRFTDEKYQKHYTKLITKGMYWKDAEKETLLKMIEKISENEER